VSTGSIERIRAFAHELAAMAKTGLEFVKDDYDRDRFHRTIRIAEELAGMTFLNGLPPGREFVSDIGVVTPKTGCCVAAFDQAGRILLIRRSDTGRWALPGGYAEVNSSPSANALRELREETGFEASIERLLGVFDNRAFASTSPYHFYTLLFRARLTGGSAQTSAETSAVEFFPAEGMPGEMSRFQRAMVDWAFADRPAPAFQ
jgi:ADP-ribose pyrophosphatase YjhB (NUDIX family)